MRLLIAEDDRDISKALVMILEKNNYSVDSVFNGKEAYEYAVSDNYDGIILDIMMPELDGIEVLTKLRSERISTPILLLTAKAEVDDRVAGLDAGADDYLAKPFAIEELIARMEVIFRRNKKEKINSELKFKDIILDIEGRTVRRNNEVIELTNTEFQLLLMFMKNINRALTRDIIMENIWGYNSEAETNVVDVYVRYIRNKLDKNDKEKYIQTIRGVGYIMRD